MKDEKKTEEQLLNESVELRQRIAELEKSEKQYKLIEQALNESEQKFRNIVEHSNELFYVHDTHHKLTYVSPQSLQILGYTPDEMMTQWTNLVTENPINKLGVEITEKALKTGNPQKPYLLELYRKDGRKVLLEIDESPLKDKDGNVIGIVGAARDITERKQKEEALRVSEDIYQTIFKTTGTAMVIDEDDMTISLANTEYERLTGYSREEMEGKCSWTEFIVKDDLVRIKDYHRLRRLDPGAAPKTYEFRLIDRKGNLKHIFATVALIPGTKKSLASLLNVTERKMAEEALIESEKKYRDLIDNASVGIYKTNLKGDILYVNEALSSLLEFESPDEMMAEGAARRYKNLKDREVLIENLKKKGEVKNFDVELLTKTGKTKNVLLSGTFDSDGLSGMIMDITERKQIEDELKESEKRFRTIFENASDGILAVDIKTKKFYLGNKMISQMLGYNQEEINTLTVMDIHPEKDLPHVLTQFEKQAKREIILAENLPVKRKDGSVFYADVNTFYITLAGKAYMAGIFRDITERKMSEEALRESEERYRTLFEESREAIYITTRDGKFVNANQSMLNLFGYTKDEMLILKALQIYVNPDERTRFQQDIEQTGFVRNYKVKFRKKDGTEMDCLLTSTLWNDINGTILGYQGIIRDITELKKVEDQLRYISLHDPLTGLYNRAYFEEEMHRVESGRYDSAGIIMCDVDGLKLVNDALGHYTGDNLLRETANILKESFREGDVAARVGGDEFAVLLPNSDRNAIEIARLRIQDAIERYNSSNPPLPLSISIGSAIGTGSSIIMTNLFKEADNNMYREKLQNSLSARSTIVQTLMKALETRDFTANGHVSRLQKLSTDLAMSIGLQEQKITDLRLLAEFHDIGKVGISDHILFKTGPLTSEEIIEMQRHCEIGHRIALCTPDLIPIANLILKHHEWWDGKGYPLGIKGKEIPLECRILAIAETYEAMTSDRPYHKAISHEEAVAELRRSSGTKFAPDLVTKFIEVLDNIKE